MNGTYHFKQSSIIRLPRGLLPALTLVCLLSLMIAQAGFAHAMLIKSEPQDHATLAEPPAQIRMWFSEDVNVDLSNVTIMGGGGQDIGPVLLGADPQQSTLVIANIPKLAPGVYTVAYQVVSKMDGHKNEGSIVFGVGQPVTSASPGMGMGSTSQQPASTPLLGVILRWLTFIAFACVTGAFVVMIAVLTPSLISRNEDPVIRVLQYNARQRVLALTVLIGGVALLFSTGFLVWQIMDILASMPGGTTMVEVGNRLLMHSRLGTLWFIRQALLVVIILIASAAYRIGQNAHPDSSQADIYKTAAAKKVLRLLALGGILTVALMISQSLTSHAVTAKTRTISAVALDTIHLLAVGAWLGGLLSLRIGLSPLIQKRKEDFVRLTRATWSPFSIVAVLSVTTLFASGLYATGVEVASPNAMLTTAYGDLLMVKILLFLIVGLFGLVNSMLLHPELFSPLWRLLRRPADWTPLSLKRMPLVTVAESSVGLAVLFIVGYLVATPTANGPEYRYAGYQQPNPLTQAAGDLSVTLAVQPNKAGSNTFNIRVSGPQGAAPLQIARLILRYKYQGESMGDQSVDAMPMGDGTFQLQGDQFTMVGPWGVDVVVRRLGVPDSTAHFDWVVPPVGQPLMVPNLDWQPVLTNAGVAILACVFLGALGLLALQRTRRNALLKA